MQPRDIDKREADIRYTIDKKVLEWKNFYSLEVIYIISDDLQWKHSETERPEQSNLPGRSPTSSPQQTCIKKDIISAV